MGKQFIAFAIMGFIIGFGLAALILGSFFDKQIEIIKNDCQIQSLLDQTEALGNVYEK
jgi:uncharacterized membrane protein YciS (DUF1049 family)